MCERITLVHWCAVCTNAIQYFRYFWRSFYRVCSFKIAKSNELQQIYTLIGSVWTCTIEKLSSGSNYPQSWLSTGVQKVCKQNISGVRMPYSAVWVEALTNNHQPQILIYHCYRKNIIKFSIQATHNIPTQ